MMAQKLQSFVHSHPWNMFITKQSWRLIKKSERWLPALFWNRVHIQLIGWQYVYSLGDFFCSLCLYMNYPISFVPHLYHLLIYYLYRQGVQQLSVTIVQWYSTLSSRSSDSWEQGACYVTHPCNWWWTSKMKLWAFVGNSSWAPLPAKACQVVSGSRGRGGKLASTLCLTVEFNQWQI